LDTPPPPKKLLDQLRDALRVKHFALSTENSYVDWAERFIRFHKMRHPDTMGEPEIAASRSVTHLAVQDNVAAPTQSQALSATLFLYRHVLHVELDGRIDLVRAKKSRHLPVVLTKAEVQAVLRRVPNEYQTMAKLLYGSGLRLMECVRLQVKDVDFAQRQIVVRDGKGMKDRVTTSRRLCPINCVNHWRLIWLRSGNCTLRIWSAATEPCTCPSPSNPCGSTPTPTANGAKRAIRLPLAHARHRPALRRHPAAPRGPQRVTEGCQRRRARRGPHQERFLPQLA
jgi:hypothetical protein